MAFARDCCSILPSGSGVSRLSTFDFRPLLVQWIERPRRRRLQMYALAADGADLQACSTAGANGGVDARSATGIKGQGALHRARLAAHAAGLALPSQTAAFVDGHLRHSDRQFELQHTRFTRCDTRQVGAHDAGGFSGVDQGRARSLRTVVVARHHDRFGWAGGGAVSAACARSEKLPFSDSTWWTLQQDQRAIAGCGGVLPPLECASSG